MSKINMKQWVAGIMQSHQKTAIPIMTNPGIELIGKTIYDAVTDGKVHHEAIAALHQRFPKSAALTVIMDLTVEAETFGADIRFSKDEVPSVIGHLLDSPSAIENLQVPGLDAGRAQQYILANKLTVINNNTDKPVLSGCIGPFSLAGRLYDMSEIMVLCYIDPEATQRLLQKCTDFIIAYCSALKETGVNGIIIAEPAAGLLSNDDCLKFSSEYVKQIIDKVQDEYFMVVLHNCGNTGHCTEAMVSSGAMGYHFGNKINMAAALADSPKDVLVMGNVDPVSVMKNGTSEEILKTVSDLFEIAENYPNYVLSTGCDVPPGISFENIDAFYQLV